MKRYLGEMIKKNYDVDDLPLSQFTGEVIRLRGISENRERSLAEYPHPLYEGT